MIFSRLSTQLKRDMAGLITPHGGELTNLLAPADQIEALKKQSLDLPNITLTPRQICDTELILNGGFSPLQGFLNKEDYEGYFLVSFLAG